MKRIATIIAALLFFAVASYGQETVDVTLLEQLPTGDITPRSPITCCVISNVIYVVFSENLGEIDVTLEEAYEGIILQTSIETASLSAVIPFAGGPGDYTITFSLPSGKVYYGEFHL